MRPALAAGALAALLSAPAALLGTPAGAQVRVAPAVQPRPPVPPAPVPAVRAPLDSATLTAGQTPPARAPIPIVLPRAVPVTDAASGTLFSALLAITRAQSIDPQAAQTAAFAYTQAVQQYRSGNIAGARTSALQALATANAAQVASATPAPVSGPALASVPAQIPGLAGGLYGADAPVVDADAFLALARGTIEDCAARRDHRVAAAKQAYAQAQQDFAQSNWQAVRRDAKAAIDACAKARP